MKHLTVCAVALLAATLCGPVAAYAQSGDISDAQADTMAKGNVWVELTKKIEIKKAKVGDPVLAKTADAVTLANATQLPKGTKLTGKITAVQGPSGDDKSAQVTFAFTQAAMRGGQTVPVSALVVGAEVPQITALASLSGGMQNNGGQVDAENAAQSGMKPADIEALQARQNAKSGNTSQNAPAGSMLVTGNIMQLTNVPVANSPGMTFSSTTGNGGEVTFKAPGKFLLDSDFKMRLEVISAP